MFHISLNKTYIFIVHDTVINARFLGCINSNYFQLYIYIYMYIYMSFSRLDMIITLN